MLLEADKPSHELLSEARVSAVDFGDSKGSVWSNIPEARGT